jgi:hypothetical protein
MVSGDETPETVSPCGEEVTVYDATLLPSYADCVKEIDACCAVLPAVSFATGTAVALTDVG